MNLDLTRVITWTTQLFVKSAILLDNNAHLLNFLCVKKILLIQVFKYYTEYFPMQMCFFISRLRELCETPKTTRKSNEPFVSNLWKVHPHDEK